MASAQCHKTCEQTCQQKNQHTSFGQKVSGFFKGHHSHSNEVTHTTQCTSQTKVLSHSGHSTTKTETQCSCTKTQTNNKRGHKKGLVQNIKDRLSEHDGSSSSSSDSESDNENCRKRKARLKLSITEGQCV
ncbi:hypothetical protein DEO72_LG2g5477 [Vigna unguiculata]|uniref:Uncharacterized protein n=1 Tax=Vigna unguiculata TaxID=3917 RepID=A0A4D6L994_VIGUN|nr:hypothetical protein DEO72_LG2g5477 [Vigna unguiculata]